MRFQEDRLPSLWVERGERDYGMDLTEHDRWMERLDQPPSRMTTADRAASTTAPRADQTLSPTSDRRPGSTLPDVSPGPTFSDFEGEL